MPKKMNNKKDHEVASTKKKLSSSDVKALERNSAKT